MGKMKKFLAIIFASAFAISSFTACGKTATAQSGQSSAAASLIASSQPTSSPQPTTSGKKGTLLMATTTSTQDTGLLDYLAPIFLKDTGWQLQWNSVGTGEALKLGENGDVDVVLVHAKASEEDFVKKGFGVKRFPVMYNDFIVVGPNKPLSTTKDVKTLFKQISAQSLPFVSRGDDSGTDKAEKKIWAALKIDPKKNKNYIESGQGMGDTLTMASEKKAYCFADRGTWLKMKKSATVPISLDIICQGDTSLKNQYGVIAVNPAKYPKLNNKAANDFITWICSDKVQKLIGQYGVDKYGQALFTPNAGTNA
jgi:ABC-type tungstate transport system, permease component